MGCVSSKNAKKSQEPSRTSKQNIIETLADDHLEDPGESRKGAGLSPVMPTLTSNTSSTANLPEAPVAKLLEGKKTTGSIQRGTAEIKEEEEDDDVKIEAPALRLRRKTSLEQRIEAEESKHNQGPSSSSPQLPQIRDITGVKETFDKNKFKKANEASLLPFSTLPLTVQDRLDEIQLFGTIAEKPTMKPLSSLTLPATSIQSSNFTGSGQPVFVRPAGSDSKKVSKGGISRCFVPAEMPYEGERRPAQ